MNKPINQVLQNPRTKTNPATENVVPYAGGTVTITALPAYSIVATDTTTPILAHVSVSGVDSKADLQFLNLGLKTVTTSAATNATAIAANTTAIATNTTDIATNTTDIATNTTAIATNTTDIAALPTSSEVYLLTGANTMAGSYTPSANTDLVTVAYGAATYAPLVVVAKLEQEMASLKSELAIYKKSKA